MPGIVLYGPPAAGKDTITTELEKLDRRYQAFARLKSGGGRTRGYRITTDAAIAELREGGDAIWENSRYGATYVVDRPGLAQSLEEGIPVVHLGQVEAVSRITESIPDRWLVVSLWCPRDVAEERIVARGSTDLAERLYAWDATGPLVGADLAINTAKVSPEQAAQLIDTEVRRVADL
ncbi:kinase [Streptosporangium saharense]|uniref:Guanylate kinase n=1 Tax=Streptosporangium saharense TaxID=1706840 RepID=A0A7W7QPS7_9ACTN|nr:kinase [Streptosporangium saharense]MBB4917433.1 guanylate kinase [Streptosporangium saharense]